jgi:hypothetical protein
VPMSLNVFISHSHDDKLIADSVKELIDAVFSAADRPRVHYSSDDSPGGGPDPLGPGWLEWILAVVRDADVCIVVLTADSLTSSWLMWETGAVVGAALSESESARATVVPLLCGIVTDDIPAPLRWRRAVNGASAKAMMQLLHHLHAKAQSSAEFPSQVAEQACPRFVQLIEELVESRARARPLRLAIAEGTPLYFVNTAFSLALQPQQGRTRNSERLVCERLSGQPHQGWFLETVRRGVFKILTHDQSRCVSVQDDSTRPNVPLMLWEYEAHETQHWIMQVFTESTNMPDTVRLVNSASRCCIAAWPSATDVLQTEIGDFSNEDWWVFVAPRLKAAFAKT